MPPSAATKQDAPPTARPVRGLVAAAAKLAAFSRKQTPTPTEADPDANRGDEDAADGGPEGPGRVHQSGLTDALASRAGDRNGGGMDNVRPGVFA